VETDFGWGRIRIFREQAIGDVLVRHLAQDCRNEIRTNDDDPLAAQLRQPNDRDQILVARHQHEDVDLGHQVHRIDAIGDQTWIGKALAPGHLASRLRLESEGGSVDRLDASASVRQRPPKSVTWPGLPGAP